MNLSKRILGLLCFLVFAQFPEIVQSEEKPILPYCDAVYRVTKNGTTADIKVVNCGPGTLFPKYRTRTKNYVKGLRYKAKTINGVAVDSPDMKVRIVFGDKYFKGIEAVIFPENQQNNLD